MQDSDQVMHEPHVTGGKNGQVRLLPNAMSATNDLATMETLDEVN
jgi:hypothetical protein